MHPDFSRRIAMLMMMMTKIIQVNHHFEQVNQRNTPRNVSKGELLPEGISIGYMTSYVMENTWDWKYRELGWGKGTLLVKNLWNPISQAMGQFDFTEIW